MFGSAKFRAWLRHPGFNKKDSDAPDYDKLAEASKEAAKIMADLGYSQLDFSKQQYEDAKPIFEKIVNQQMGIADQTAKQGADYYNYQKSYRPTEQYMMLESMGLNADEISNVMSGNRSAYDNYMSQLVDESGLQADLAAAKTALEGTSLYNDYTKTTTTTSSAPGSQSGLLNFFGSIVGDLDGSEASVTTIEEKIREKNPEYADALAKLTDAQKQALFASAKNESLRQKANEALYASNPDVFATAAKRRELDLAEYDAANKADAAKITMDPTALYEAHRGEIDNQVGRAVADTQGAYTRSLNQAIRQGLRYGAGGNQIIGQVGQVGMAQASQQASAANVAREMGIQGVRTRANDSLGLRQNNRAAINKEKAIDWAKKLDAAGLVKGLPGASQGAYGLAINAGNSAGQNQMAPGQAYLQGAQGAAQTIGSGQQMMLSGYGNVLNNQTQMATSGQDAGMAGALGSVAGAAITVF